MSMTIYRVGHFPSENIAQLALHNNWYNLWKTNNISPMRRNKGNIYRPILNVDVYNFQCCTHAHLFYKNVRTGHLIKSSNIIPRITGYSWWVRKSRVSISYKCHKGFKIYNSHESTAGSIRKEQYECLRLDNDHMTTVTRNIDRLLEGIIADSYSVRATIIITQAEDPSTKLLLLRMIFWP